MRKNISRVVCLLLLFLFLSYGGSPTLFASTISISDTVSVSAVVSGTTSTPPLTTPGSHGGRIVYPQTSVLFTGEAYPYAPVTVLRNGIFATSVQSDANGLFSATLIEKYDSTTLYTLYAIDRAGVKSVLINYPLVVTTGYLTYLSGIRFAPTIVLDKVQASIGDYLTVAGYALPAHEIQIAITNQDTLALTAPKIFTLTTPQSGRYDITLPLLGLPAGNYSVAVTYTNDTRVSKLVKLIIGTANISSTTTVLHLPGDCNADQVINLVDFSVLAFWYKKPNPPACVDINHDGIVNLTDFSILAFYWTDY